MYLLWCLPSEVCERSAFETRSDAEAKSNQVGNDQGLNQIICAVLKRQNANTIQADKHPDINQRRKPCFTNKPQAPPVYH
jgi:hypothetical protein